MPVDPTMNILDAAFEKVNELLRRDGKAPLDEASFVQGFMCCFGVITGKIDIGLDEHARLDRILDVVHRNLMDYGRRAEERVLDDQEQMRAILSRMNGHGG